MELFTRLFGDLLAFVYHCLDRVVIHGYLSGLSRPEQVVHFVRQVMGTPVVSMEQGRTFRISVPKYPTPDPNHRILAHQRSRFTHYYFYIRDEVLGPIIVRVAGFFPFHATYWLHGHSCIERELERAGIAFRKDDNAFLAVDDVAALQAAADRLSPAIIRKQLDYWTLILGPKFSRKERAQMNSRYLRNELCSNNLRDFGLKKGLDHLDAVRKRFRTITDRFAGFQAECLYDLRSKNLQRPRFCGFRPRPFLLYRQPGDTGGQEQ